MGSWHNSKKYHLRRVIVNQVLTFKELSTVFCAVDAVLNSHALCSSDHAKVEVLTAEHFLTSDILIVYPGFDGTGAMNV